MPAPYSKCLSGSLPLGDFLCNTLQLPQPAGTPVLYSVRYPTLEDLDPWLVGAGEVWCQPRNAITAQQLPGLWPISPEASCLWRARGGGACDHGALPQHSQLGFTPSLPFLLKQEMQRATRSYGTATLSLVLPTYPPPVSPLSPLLLLY